MAEAGEAAWRAVGAARGWVGTPYVFGASLRGAGADCLGLLRGVWRTLYGAEPERPGPYTPDWSEASGAERLLEGAARHMTAVALDDARPGDVAVFRMRAGAVCKHLGILAEDAHGAPTLIHAYSGHGVVESSLGMAWRRKMAAAFRLPEGVI
ncbi:MAG: peptidase [Alphaproteobacteria bacterium]|nr:peptidase [Alphaproteobacteria bacterium]